jgi:hypothetical protein
MPFSAQVQMCSSVPFSVGGGTVVQASGDEKYKSKFRDFVIFPEITKSAINL